MGTEETGKPDSAVGFETLAEALALFSALTPEQQRLTLARMRELTVKIA